MNRILPLLACTLAMLACCACAPLARQDAVAASPPMVLHDELFPAVTTPVDPAHVFDLDERMRAFLKAHLVHPGHGLTPQGALAEAFSHPELLKLNYDASRTRSAQEAFADRAGNCLSLVMLTAAFARALDLRVEYHETVTTPYWSRNGELLLASGHINISVLPTLRDLETGHGGRDYLFDFLDTADAFALPRRDVGERTVVAMFLNNRAAEALQDRRPDLAYAYVRQAIGQDPTFALPYNTLGVIYLGAGAVPAAVQSFRAALQADPDNARALGNLVETLRQSGATAEADRLAERLARLEPDPPFHWFDLGVAAYQRGDYGTAQTLFRREAKLTDYSAELHFWMARTAWALGQSGRARTEIEQALDRSTTLGDRSRYAAKLEWLKQQAQLTN